ncbi:hypothetical protein B0J17DRAFT_769003 [Rhizoctonia solani]|nr:hypothetical protein B0J17DRAFT_769003 [Rhizoctonia solani]
MNSGQTVSEFVTTEMKTLTTFREKAVRVKRALGRARNSLTSLVSISSISDDILLHIFRLVMDESLLKFEDQMDHRTPHVHILAPSQVCTRWRQISLSSRSLWSQIKLSIRREILLLGDICADRSGDLPLNIRVIEPFGRSDTYHRRSLTHFFSKAGPRVASFELAVLSPLRAPRSMPYFYILGSSFKRWEPGQLTRLILFERNIPNYRELGEEGFNHSKSAHWFLFPRTMMEQAINKNGRAVQFEVDSQHFEDVLSHVKVLELDAVYPFWASKAYHGLVELRLIGPRRLTTVIAIQELANILASSPGLRVLQLGLEVSLDEISPEPVHLRDLEVFVFHSLHHDTQQAALKLLAPGQKPLQMFTVYNGSELRCLPAEFHDEFYQFFRRSNISYLKVYGSILSVELPKLLELLLNLETLVLRQAELKRVEQSDQDGKVASICSQLRNLHLFYCTFDLKTLQWMVNTHNLRMIALYHSVVRVASEDGLCGDNQCIPMLQSISPFIHVLDGDSAPKFGDRVLALSDIYSRDTSALVMDYMLH